VASFGVDLGLFARIWATHASWQEGYPDRARAEAAETLSLAGELAHPFSVTLTLAYAAMLHQFCRDVAEATRLAEATIAHATEHGFSYYLAWGQILRGWCLAMDGDAAGLAGITRGIGILQATAGLRLPYYRGLLADASARFGLIDDGLQAVAEGLAETGRTGERWFEAELHRLRGELLRMTSRAGEAEACFRTALEESLCRRARSFELRAAVSLARLWREQGKPGRGRRSVAGVYDRFTEGFDTRDLQEAAALLQRDC
jgi:adenylate cyclase